VTGFLGTVAGRLADRWVALLLAPSAVFLLAAWAAPHLGWSHALDWHRLADAADTTAAQRWTGAAQATALAAAATAATGLGWAVRLASAVTSAVWCGWTPGRGPLSSLARIRTERLRGRWQAAVDDRHALQDRDPLSARTPQQQDRINTAAATANKIALAEPSRPTWIGNRLHALDTTIADTYDVDLTYTWPRLWLVLPETARSEISKAHAAFAAATVQATWALPWLALGILWWPALLVAAGLAQHSHRSAHTAIDTLAHLVEAAVDVHGADLAAALGVTSRPELLTAETGAVITRITRKNR
jgi:hypothetical protein